MAFSDILSDYMTFIPASAKEISKASGLSMATISRFKNGKRIPSLDGKSVEKIASALSNISSQKQHLNIPKEQIYEKLMSGIESNNIDFNHIASNFNALIVATGMNISQLSRYLSFDPSYLSRIRSGQRKPANINKFLADVSTFTATHYGIKCKNAIAQLINCNEDDLGSEASCKNIILDWLSNGNEITENVLDKFFEKLDNFDLNEYIRSIHFDDIKIPTTYFQISTSKDYYGNDGYMKAELAWLKATATSHSEEPVIMYSDMEFEELTKDPEYPKKWMYGLAVLLKKGLKLNIIHNFDRSFYEMMIGLEAWIPLYMTGQVSPYYIKGAQGTVFHHFIRVSGESTVNGESVMGCADDAIFHFSKSNDEVTYYKKRGSQILSKALPLMDIYRNDMASEFLSNFKKLIDGETRRIRSILPSPPLYTISAKLLNSILDNNNVNPEEKKQIIDFAKKSNIYFESMITKGEITDEIHIPTEEEFNRFPAVLLLSDIFYENDIFYTYKDFMKHIKETKAYAKKRTNYSVKTTNSFSFNHIQIRVSDGKWVMISKDKSPAIHFVIKHPQLRQAIERMISIS